MAGMIPADIGALAQATEVALAPHGNLVAFTLKSVDVDRNNYRSRIWVSGTNGGLPPRPFTAGELGDHLPRWSPDASRLALITNRSVDQEDESCDLVVIPVSGGGERIRVLTWPEQVTELAWSPDGTSIAFVARDPDEERYGRPGVASPKERDIPPRRLTRLFSRLDSEGWEVDRPSRLFVVPADGSSRPIALTTDEHQASGVSWSPAGSELAFVSARHETWDLDLATDLWRVAADGQSQPVKLTETVASYSHPSWSPGGGHLAYLRLSTPLDEPRHVQVGLLDLSSGNRTELTTSLDRNCAPYPDAREPVWDGDTLLFAIEDAGNVHLYRVAADGTGKPQLVVGGDRCLSAWDASAGRIAFVASTPLCPAEVFVIDSAGEPVERRLSEASRSFTKRVDLVAPERFVATAPDGTEVECWAMPPAHTQPSARYPTILNVHGGPFAQYGNRFFDEFQLEAGAGFGVVYCNPRGSSGYTESWGRATRWPEAESDPGSAWGGVDFDDVMACIEEAGRRFPWVDQDRLGVMGGSYGGYMTSWIIGHNDRFKAACSERACNNLLTLEHGSDVATAFRSYVGKSHLEDPGAYLRQSPITYVDDITTPVLIVHSENDLRCPISQAEELFVALRLLGRDPELVRFPGESHELSRSGSPRHRIMRAEIILDWFRSQLTADR
jgi:dipeptidyl aminopeptidase/acylaminoacyl peptidase